MCGGESVCGGEGVCVGGRGGRTGSTLTQRHLPSMAHRAAVRGRLPSPASPRDKQRVRKEWRRGEGWWAATYDDDGVEHAAAVSGLKRAGGRRRGGQRWGVEFGQDVAAEGVPHCHGLCHFLKAAACEWMRWQMRVPAAKLEMCVWGRARVEQR